MNNNDTNAEITLMPETNNTMNRIFSAAQKQLDNIKEHEKILLHDLIDKVVAETQVKTTIAQGLISMFLEDWVGRGEGTLESGRSGGIYKGGKKQRVDMRPRCTGCGNCSGCGQV